jgi:hypothetical protein
MQRWLYFRLNGPSVADADGLWFSSLLDDGQALWTHPQQALLNSANASNHRIVYIPGGLAGAPSWFYYETQSRQFIPIL